MTDEAAITTLLHTYAERLDAGDLDGAAALFADGTFRAERGPVRSGAAAVAAAFRRLVVLHDGSPRTRHVITNVIVEVDAAAGRATARSYFTVFQATATLPLQPILAGRYHDRFVRDGARWRFAERCVLLDLRGDLSQHLHPTGGAS